MIFRYAHHLIPESKHADLFMHFIIVACYQDLQLLCLPISHVTTSQLVQDRNKTFSK